MKTNYPENSHGGYKTLEAHADTMRFVLDKLCCALDARNSEELRIRALDELADREDLYFAVLEVKECFRTISNTRTDNQKDKICANLNRTTELVENGKKVTEGSKLNFGAVNADLLDVLKGLHDIIILATSQTESAGDIVRSIGNHLDKARLAIAKAEGE